MVDDFHKAVVLEMESQNLRFGDNRTLPDWVWETVMGEEIGEVCSAVLPDDQDRHGNVMTELVQVAAVAHQWIDQMVRAGRVFSQHTIPINMNNLIPWVTMEYPEGLPSLAIPELHKAQGHAAAWVIHPGPDSSSGIARSLARIIAICYTYHEILNPEVSPRHIRRYLCDSRL